MLGPSRKQLKPVLGAWADPEVVTGRFGPYYKSQIAN